MIFPRRWCSFVKCTWNYDILLKVGLCWNFSLAFGLILSSGPESVASISNLIFITKNKLTLEFIFSTLRLYVRSIFQLTFGLDAMRLSCTLNYYADRVHRRKRNVTVCRPSVCLSVCPVGILTVTHRGRGSMQRGQRTVRRTDILVLSASAKDVVTW